MAPGPYLASPLAFINKILLEHNPDPVTWSKGVSEEEG